MYNYGGWATPLKNMISSVGIINPYMVEKSNSCSKPPTSI